MGNGIFSLSSSVAATRRVGKKGTTGGGYWFWDDDRIFAGLRRVYQSVGSGHRRAGRWREEPGLPEFRRVCFENSASFQLPSTQTDANDFRLQEQCQSSSAASGYPWKRCLTR
jgi:hypothetical protein